MALLLYFSSRASLRFRVLRLDWFLRCDAVQLPFIFYTYPLPLGSGLEVRIYFPVVHGYTGLVKFPDYIVQVV